MFFIYIGIKIIIKINEPFIFYLENKKKLLKIKSTILPFSHVVSRKFM